MLTRRSLLTSAAALTLAPGLALAAAPVSLPLRFRIASDAALNLDLADFCAANGYLDGQGAPLIQMPGSGATFGPHLRFDFDVWDLVDGLPNGATIAVGRHVNAQISFPDFRGPTPTQQAVSDLVRQQLGDWFAGQSLATITPAAPLVTAFGAVTRQWRTTARGTSLIDPAPLLPKRG